MIKNVVKVNQERSVEASCQIIAILARLDVCNRALPPMNKSARLMLG